MYKEKFCVNPSCDNHIDVDSGLMTITIMKKSELKEIDREVFIDNKGHEYWFCDACTKAIKMILELQGNKND